MYICIYIYIYIHIHKHKNKHVRILHPCFQLWICSAARTVGHCCSRAMKRKAVGDQVEIEPIKLEVCLLSGQSVKVAVPQSGTVADLQIAAQQSLEQPFLNLAAPDGRLLDPTDSLS